MQLSHFLKTYNFPTRAVRNLGTFNTSYMSPNAQDVFFNYACVNAVDSHAYPELTLIKKYCADFLLDLMHASPQDDFRYFTTSGSSESVLLAILLLKKKYQSAHPHHEGRLNIVIGTNSHIAWFKAARYLDIDFRIARTDNLSFVIDNAHIMSMIDEYTIGICCTLGAPTTLVCDDILSLNNLLIGHLQATGQYIPIHVDAASGGFVMPFRYPEALWDFSLPHVFSINISSHKYGLVYPSLGWLLTRYTPCLDELLDESDYLGASIKRFSIQFSHSASHLMTQYYYIQTYGKEGYAHIINKLYDYADHLQNELIKTQKNIQFLDSSALSLPGLVFSIKDIDLEELSRKLKEKNWYLPVYSLPNSGIMSPVARVVIRYGYDVELIDKLVSDIALITRSMQTRTKFTIPA